MVAFAGVLEAQIKPGLHVARATDTFEGVNGVGASVQVGLPVLPLKLFVAGEYFFPGCDGCSFWGGSADLHVSLPIPIVSPYVAAGLVLRNTSLSDTVVRTGGLGFGAGVNLNTLVVGGYVEGRYEFMDGGDDQLVIRLGIRF